MLRERLLEYDEEHRKARAEDAPGGTPGKHTLTERLEGPPLIGHSVGAGGRNHRRDVGVVQHALARNGYSPGPIDHIVGSRTISAIRAFQATILEHPDGLIEVDRATEIALRRLARLPRRASRPRAAMPKEPSDHVSRLEPIPSKPADEAATPAPLPSAPDHGSANGSQRAAARGADRMDAIARLGDEVAEGESKRGGYNAYNTGTRNNRVVHAGVRDLASMTVDEILEASKLPPEDRNRVFAAGKYQVIPKTLAAAKAQIPLTGQELFTPELQEKIFLEFLIGKKRPKVDAYIRQGTGTSEDATYEAAMEWASIEVPAGRKIRDGRISDGHMSYYESGANHAKRGSGAKIKAALENAREAFARIQNGEVADVEPLPIDDAPHAAAPAPDPSSDARDDGSANHAPNPSSQEAPIDQHRESVRRPSAHASQDLEHPTYAGISKNFHATIAGSSFTWHEALWLPSWGRHAQPSDVTNESFDRILANIERQATALQRVRDHLGKKLVVHCWLRPPAYNVLVKGAKNSSHLRGMATDFHVEGMSAESVREVLKAERIYPGAGENNVRWIHLDLEHERWFNP